MSENRELAHAALAVVLFEGAGGATHGLHTAGYETVGYDFWQPAVTCARANGFDAHLHDLSDPAADHLIADADLWWASPPCQPFSAAGDGEGEFDDRDGFPWVLRLVAARLPKVLIVENVKGLTFRKHSAYFCAVLEGFRALGYEVDWRVLNCADHGVPQTRERTIIVCRRDGGPIVWPMPTHCETGGMFTAKWVTMAEALGWNADDELTYNRGAGMTERHGPRGPFPVDRPAPTVHNNTAKDIRRMTLHYRQTDSHGTPITCDVTDRPAPTISTQSGSPWLLTGNNSIAGGPLATRSLDEPAMTVGTRGDLWCWTRSATTSNGDNRVSAPGHHDPNVSGSQQAGAIRLTIAELAALQGFPADWVWTGTKTTNAKLIGNAVPPALAHAVAAVNRPIDDAGTAPVDAPPTLPCTPRTTARRGADGGARPRTSHTAGSQAAPSVERHPRTPSGDGSSETVAVATGEVAFDAVRFDLPQGRLGGEGGEVGEDLAELVCAHDPIQPQTAEGVNHKPEADRERAILVEQHADEAAYRRVCERRGVLAL